MGFKDATWAYSIDRPLAETAVLAALCLRTDDSTHETFVGQRTLASMLGSSPEKIMRALRTLESAGVITRARRHSHGGYRTTDLITVNVATYGVSAQPDDSPTRQNAYKENRARLTDISSPTYPTNSHRRRDHSVDHSEISQQRGHEHETNAREALTRIRQERALPLSVDELLRFAYALGDGDPWAGYRHVSQRTEAALSGAINPAAALRSRLRDGAQGAVA